MLYEEFKAKQFLQLIFIEGGQKESFWSTGSYLKIADIDDEYGVNTFCIFARSADLNAFALDTKLPPWLISP